MASESTEFTISEIKQSYRKLKHYNYYDNSNLLLRRKIALFESSGDFEDKLQYLCDSLNSFVKTKKADKFLSKCLSSIDYKVLPKSYKPQTNGINDSNGTTFFTNITFEEKITVEKVVFFIDAPIEIHLISVLWIMREGYKLEDDLNKISPPFGYKLERKGNKRGIVDGLKLFKPYFREYQSWRDGAIKKAKDLASGGTDVAIIGLDVKEYFESIQLDFGKLEKKLKSIHGSDDFLLTHLLYKVHLKYWNKRSNKKTFKRRRAMLRMKKGLPIGLLSSGILGNWCLSILDKNIKENLDPIYYGRYVDDVLIVLGNPRYDKSVDSNNFNDQFFEKYFIKKNVLEYKEKDKQYLIKGTHFYIQKKKVSLMFFSAKEPITILEKFVNELRKNSSEFRFLPEEQSFESEFENAAHSIVYSGSKLKLRSIKDFMNDKFGVSKFLAKKIYASLQADRVKDKKVRKQLITYFRGQRLIELYHLWEKVVTYFLITEDTIGLEQILRNLSSAFEKIEVEPDLQEYEGKLKSSMKIYAGVAISMALALDLNLNKRVEILINKVAIDENSFRLKIKKLPEALRKSNMLRHSFVFHPLLNFTRLSVETDTSLIKRNLNLSNAKLSNNGNSPFEFTDLALEYSPRFVHYHEAVIFELTKELNNCKDGLDIEKSELKIDILNEYLNNSFDQFYRLNYAKRTKFKKSDKKYSKIRNEYFPENGTNNSKINNQELPNDVVENLNINTLSFMTERKKQALKVGLINIRVYETNMKQSYLKNPIISKARRNEINDLLNQVSKTDYSGKVDMVVFPETCIPYKWLGWICEHARKHELLSVFGLEHWVVNNIAYNFVVTLVPIKVSSDGALEESKRTFNAIIPIIRLKNHYSPGETKILKGYFYNIPIPKPKYDLITWKGLSFSVFNCFELANISHRSAFRSKVDFLVACEYNRDTNYFSNVVDAVTRDVHCYFIQSNNSEFGDNRISKPSKTAEKDIIKIKGGKNTTILVETINIKKLRDFQIMDHNLQLDDKSFKPTPPGFDVKEVKMRMGFIKND
ncbi:MAG TPA: hypothetical protein ENJ95_01670 [Bacteroidetes bacterium]|nr:hypothetical protein [Bacteroidota bacterium]